MTDESLTSVSGDLPVVPVAVDEREQVARQCRAIAHQARAIAQIHEDYARMFSMGCADELIPMVGKRTAGLMEYLGDFMNETDCVTEEDAWLDPIFATAHIMFPLDATPTAPVTERSAPAESSKDLIEDLAGGSGKALQRQDGAAS